MPPFAIWTLRSSLVCLLLAWLLELWRVAQPQLVPTLIWADRATIYHLFFVGWLTQLIFGVAHWMFPTESRERPRGRNWLNIAIFLCLNLGLWARAIAAPLRMTPHWTTSWAVVLIVGGSLQWLAAACFCINIWRRIKPKGSKTKKDRYASA